MKKLLLLSLIISLRTLGQAIEIKPGSNGFVLIPNVATLGTCAAPDKGKIVFFSNDNTLRMCNGSTWVNISSGSFAVPYSYTGSSESSFIKLENTFFPINGRQYTDPVISAISQNPGTIGVYGESLGWNATTLPAFEGIGVKGYGYIGVYGQTNTNGFGVKGYSNSGYGGYFSSSSGYSLVTSGRLRFGGSGVGNLEAGKFLKSTNSFGDAEWSDLFPLIKSQSITQPLLEITNNNSGAFNTAVFKTNTSAYNSAVLGQATNNTTNAIGIGISGENLSTNSFGYGVFGTHAGTGIGVYGYSNSGRGVSGVSSSGVGLEGTSNGSGIGIKGTGTTGIGGSFTATSGLALVTINGKVSIGNTTPSLATADRMEINGRLRIRHDIETSGIWFNKSTNTIGTADGAFFGMNSDTQAGIFIGGVWHFLVNNVGDATLSGTLMQSSDLRLKKDILPLSNSLSNIDKLNGYHYKWIETSRSQDLQTGLIAQEVQKIFPELVKSDDKGMLSVNYIGLVPHLIEAVKELTLKNNSLESRLGKIEAMFTGNELNAKK